jgi:uncharacterized zinc-type alcohol dehydrogenase-like protein
MSVSAYAAKEAKAQLESFAYEADTLEADQVEVGITHCGICYSDIHLIDDDWGMSAYPLVPGHEIVGVVKAKGEGVKHLEVGDRVGIGWQRDACYTCDVCVSGHDNLCAEAKATCMGAHGGFADAIRVSSQYAFRIPDALESENAAPLLCGGITVYSPFELYNVKPGQKVGVIGIGGLGHLALQFAKAWGCEVTAFSHSPNKEEEARNFGADHFISSSDAEALEAAAGSLDFIISTVHANLDWNAYMAMLRPNGKLCFVGATPEPIELPVFSLIMGNRSVVGSQIGSRIRIREMLEMAAKHGIEAETELMPMSEVNKAVQHVRDGKARYRVVLDASK